jgi:predicted site-specific integrase-resolvase
VREAAELAGVSQITILKRIDRGQLLAVALCKKGWLVCAEAAMGLPYDEDEFVLLCDRYASVPEACEIVCVTDGMIGRMLTDGRLRGFRLNEKAWAVDRASCEENIREYMKSPPQRGQPRRLNESRAPRKRSRKTA